MVPLAERYRLPTSQRTRVLLVAILVVLLAGVALAATQPGNLGDDDETAAAPATSTGTTATGGAGGTTSTTADQVTSTTEVETDPEAEPATPTVVDGEGSAESPGSNGSGLGSSGAGSAAEDDLAATGGAPLALPALVFLVLAGLGRLAVQRHH